MNKAVTLALTALAGLAALSGCHKPLPIREPAKTTTRPADEQPVQAPQEDEYAFMRVYRAGENLDLAQSVTVRVWASDAAEPGAEPGAASGANGGVDSTASGLATATPALIDAFWAERFAVRVSERPGLNTVRVAVRLRDKTQRGLPSSGAYYTRYAGLTDPPGPPPSNMGLEDEAILFVADVDDTGRVTAWRGAERGAASPEVGRANDRFRQAVEEPSLYLPRFPVRPKTAWQIRRTVQQVYGLAADATSAGISETTDCRLVSVTPGPEGRRGTIEFSGRLTAADDKGAKRVALTKSGRICYNLDEGRVVWHTMTLQGRLPQGHLPAGTSAGPFALVRVTVSLSLTPAAAAGKSGGTSGEPPAPGLPAIDKDGRVFFAYRRGTTIIPRLDGPAIDGDLWTMPPPPPPSPANRESLDRLEYPVAVVDPRRLADGSIAWDFRPVAADAAGQVWALEPEKGDKYIFQTPDAGDLAAGPTRIGTGPAGLPEKRTYPLFPARVRSIRDGRLQTKEYVGYTVAGPAERPRSIGRAGKDLFADSMGNLLLAGRGELHVHSADGWSMQRFPLDRADGRGLRPGLAARQYTLFRQIGEVVYVARNFCPEPGGVGAHSSVFAWRRGAPAGTGWVAGQQVSFLGAFAGRLMVGTASGLWTLSPVPKTPLDESGIAEIRRLIDRLADPSSRVSDAADDALLARCVGSEPGREMLADAARTSRNIEQSIRLDYLLQKIGGVADHVVRPLTLDGFAALDPLMETRDGVQWFRPWQPGKLHPEPLLLALAADGNVRRIDLSPLADPHTGQIGLVRLELQAPDGAILGLGGRSVFSLSPDSGRVRPLLLLGRFADDDASVRLIAADKGRFCFRTDTGPDAEGDSGLCFWYDPASEPESRMIEARAVASGVAVESNRCGGGAVAVGAGGDRLWMLMDVDGARQNLGYAQGANIIRLPGTIAAERGAVLPLNSTAALFVSDLGGPVYLHTGEQLYSAETLRDLVRRHFDELLPLTPAGRIYRCGRPGRAGLALVRLGKQFWLTEGALESRQTGTPVETVGFSGLCTKDEAREIPLGRIIAADPKTERLLAYTPDGGALGWFDAAGRFTPELRRDFAFDYCQPDRTDEPALRGQWVLTPEAVERAKRKLADAAPLDRQELRAFRLWSPRTRDSAFDDPGTPTGWRLWQGPVSDGAMFSDSTGAVWQVRSRELLVQLADGRRQLIPLPDAMEPGYCAFAEEEGGAVWLATDQSFIRLLADRDTTDRITQYRINQRFSLRNFGYRVRGPWILNGIDFYFTSGGRLYRTTVGQLLGRPAPEAPEPTPEIAAATAPAFQPTSELARSVVLTTPGVHTEGKWKCQVHPEADPPEASLGKPRISLFYDDRPVPADHIGDHIRTPWGTLFFDYVGFRTFDFTTRPPPDVPTRPDNALPDPADAAAKAARIDLGRPATLADGPWRYVYQPRVKPPTQRETVLAGELFFQDRLLTARLANDCIETPWGLLYDHGRLGASKGNTSPLGTPASVAAPRQAVGWMPYPATSRRGQSLSPPVATAADDEESPDPAEVRRRIDLLRAKADRFALALIYQGPHDRPYWDLWLNTVGLPSAAAGPPPNQLQGRLDRAQARAIVNYLARDGFARRASALRPRAAGLFAGQGYRLEVSAGELALFEDIEFGSDLLGRLEGLRSALDIESAALLGRLIQPLVADRRAWEITPSR